MSDSDLADENAKVNRLAHQNQDWKKNWIKFVGCLRDGLSTKTRIYMIPLDQVYWVLTRRAFYKKKRLHTHDPTGSSF